MTRSNASIPLPQGYQYFWYDEIDSTNLEALRKSATGLNADSWFCAERQTNGRGTKGAEWLFEQGNLYASLLTHTDCPPGRLSQISVLAGLAAITAIEHLAPDDFYLGDLCLKWPNDILLRGQKICGVLVESRHKVGTDLSEIVIGTGINLADHPETDGLFPAGDLVQSGWSCSREQLFVALVQSTRDWMTIWRNGEDFEILRQAWLERFCHLGRTIKIRLGENEFEGRFNTMSSRGALVLNGPDGQPKAFTSGHIINIEGPHRRS